MHDGADSLAALGVLPPLVDPATGDPYESFELPCATDPDRWDPEAPRPTRRVARLACGRCPARRACSDRADSLGALATGVWGGRDRGERPDDDAPRVYDSTVAAWQVDAAVVLRAPRPPGRRARAAVTRP